MQKTFILLSALLCLLNKFSAFEPGRLYGSFFGGANFLSFNAGPFDIDLRTGYCFSLGFGYAFSDGFLLEVEGARRFNKVVGAEYHHRPFSLHGSCQSTSALINALYLFNFKEASPYFGFGLGYVENKVDLKNEFYKKHLSKSSFAGQILVGVSKKVTDCMHLSLEYRYFDARFNAREHAIGLKINSILPAWQKAFH